MRFAPLSRRNCGGRPSLPAWAAPFSAAGSRASSGLACPEVVAGNLATYRSSRPQVLVPRYRGMAARWHDQLYDLARASRA
jgi:hypothetical protein